MTETRDFLLEIGLEEIPARFLPPAITQMRELAEVALKDAGLNYNQLDVYATPRRLVLMIGGLAEKAEDIETESKGPSLTAAYDDAGQPTRALLGFCKGQGIEPADVLQKEINGNTYIFVKKTLLGKHTKDMLPELIYGIINKLYFPKPMRWGYQSMRFARPIRWLLALFGTEVIDIELADVKSSNISRGHRLLGSDNIVINQPDEYLAKLSANYVIVDQNKRREIIWQQIQQVADAQHGYVEPDEELLEEVTYLLEYPTALSGGFEEKYLAIPKELVITPMREHQRYFPVYNERGDLLPRFITVRNGDARHLDIVAAGNEKVLRARLADAEFFYTEDLKANMADKVEELANVVFHEKLGSMRQKVTRIGTIATYLAGKLGYDDDTVAKVKRAAYLAKADLGSHAVYEFTELQGIMGEYYAKAAGEDEEVAVAIREHYLPRFAGDELPETKVGIVVALADKLDNLCGFFAVGLIPSGSQDPYALRRAASGCVQIILKHGLQLNVRELAAFVCDLIKADVPDIDEDLLTERIENINTFMKQRLENNLTENGISYDVVNAVSLLNDGNIYTTAKKAYTIQDYRKTDGFAPLLAGFTRAANLVRSGIAKNGFDPNTTVDESLFGCEEEQLLHKAVSVAKFNIKSSLVKNDYVAALTYFSEVGPFIDRFFDAVMVMDKDDRIRNNRLALLQEVVLLTAKIGDLSKLVS